MTKNLQLKPDQKAKASNNLLNYFYGNSVCVQDKILKLDNVHLSAGLKYLSNCSSKELVIFKDKKFLENHTEEKVGIICYKTCLEETAKLRTDGHLSDFINIESFTGVNFKLPMLDEHSPLSLSILNYLHFDKYKHKGAETLYRLSLQHCYILNGRKLFCKISEDCSFCHS